MTESSILDAALAAHTAGLCPIRAKTDGTKAPLGQWKRWQSERPEESDIRTWFSDWPNLGLVTGTISDRLICLEFEQRAMGMLPNVRDALTQAGLWSTFHSWLSGYSELSPSGGLHILIHMGGDGPLDGNDKIAADAQGLTLIETRGEGGFVITAPSNGSTHPSGEAWVHQSGSFDEIAWVAPEEWAAVRNILAGFGQRHPSRPPAAAPRIEGVLARDGWIEQAKSRLPSMSVVLESYGWTFERADAEHSYWVRPGKPMHLGHSATINDNDRLFVFSSNAYPVPLSRDTQTYDVTDVVGCYRFGRMPSDSERVEVLRELTGGPAPIAAPAATSPPPPALRLVPSLGNRECLLDGEFWAARPELEHIRAAAQSRFVSPDAVLHAVLARVAACSSHQIHLPPLIGGSLPLSYLAMLVGPPEAGKSGAAAVARALIRPTPGMIDNVPIGTGEGLSEILFEMVAERDPETGKSPKVKRQVHHNVCVFVDEGTTLTAISARKGSTLMPTMRTIFTGGTLGNANASAEARRIVPAGGAVYGITVAVQPEMADRLLSHDEIIAGTPQRFCYATAIDPYAPQVAPIWPGELEWEPPGASAMEARIMQESGHRWSMVGLTSTIIATIRNYRTDTMAGVARDPLEAHSMLLTEKLAALLAVLDRRLDVSDEDWQLALTMMDVSRCVRGVVQSRIRDNTTQAEEAADARVARRAIKVATVKYESDVDRAAQRVAEMVRRHPDGMRRTTIRSDGSELVRRNIDEAIALAVERGWIELRTEPSPTGDKKRYHAT